METQPTEPKVIPFMPGRFLVWVRRTAEGPAAVTEYRFTNDCEKVWDTFPQYVTHANMSGCIDAEAVQAAGGKLALMPDGMVRIIPPDAQQRALGRIGAR